MNNKNKNFYVKKDQLTALAEAFFVRIYGSNFHNDSDDLKQVNETRQYIIKNIKPDIVFSCHRIKEITNAGLKLENGIQLKGDFFSCFKKEEKKIEFLIASLATIGSIDIKEDIGLTKRFYIDIWGTAYLEALRTQFNDYLFKKTKESTQHLFDSFGPGHYGIPLENLSAIFKLVDTASVSVKLINDKMLSPDKSSAEIVFVSSEPLSLQLNPCKTCLAKSNCMFCKFYHK